MGVFKSGINYHPYHNIIESFVYRILFPELPFEHSARRVISEALPDNLIRAERSHDQSVGSAADDVASSVDGIQLEIQSADVSDNPSMELER